MKKTILLFFYLSSSILYGQSLDIVDSLKKSGNIYTALNEYIKVLSLDTNQHSIHLKIARCHSLLGNTDIAFSHLKKGVNHDTINKWMIEPDFFNICESQKWSSLLNLQIQKMTNVQRINNSELTKQLWIMALKDQAYYYHIKVAMQNNLAQSILWEHFWLLKKKLNDKNLSDLLKIIDEFGWPKISDVGSLAASTAFFIIQHSDYEIQKKYYSYLEKAVKENEATKKELAYLTDRILVHEGKPQLYGSQRSRNLETGEVKMYPVEDPENLNKRRVEMGMKPIDNLEELLIK